MKGNRFFSLFVILLLCLYAKGQTLDEAKGWYQEGRFAEALPVFRAEYTANPTNPSLNQWLGASLYETGNMLEAQKYLEFASGKKIVEAYLYLGDLYAKLYRFEDALKEFDKYQRAKRKDNTALGLLEQKRAEADRLRRAVGRTEDLQVIDSVVVPKAEFLPAYKLSASSGSLMPVQAFFSRRPATDQTLYMNERKDKIFYSAGDSGSGINLYSMDKLLESFGDEKRLPATVNMGSNQAFPFVLSDGLTLYFASSGEPSFGGYDLFVTRYNLASDSYLTPNQLNMPYNSPFNDYLLVIDEEKGVGWFASDRFQPADSVCIYTFVPNPQVQLVESDDEAYLARRARISSIADTQKEGADYGALRAAAQRETVQRQQTAGDFSFVINDKATYRKLADFRSGQARSLFSQALEYEKQLRALDKELSLKRDQFAAGTTGDSLSASILALEKQSETLYRETERLKTEARNEEIRSYFTK